MSDPPHEPAPRSERGLRLAVSVGALVAAFLLERVALPEVDPENELSALFRPDPKRTSVVVTGLFPLVAAAVLVELAALAIPSLRRSRSGPPEGRLRLDRA